VQQGVAGSDAGEFRRRLWNTVMNGQYPASAGRNRDADSLRQMKILADFFGQTRHWDLEPFFDVDGGRAVALESVEYIVYAEKPGPVEVLTEKHNYDIRWFNPSTGEWIKQKDYKGERYTGEPPGRSQDWVLHISREGKKESMLRSYKFESRPVLMQEIEVIPQKTPFEIQEPSADPLPFGKSVPYAARIRRETRATRSMMWLWTGEVSAGGQGYRVLGTGPNGNFTIPENVVKTFPAVFTLRLYGMNANGKIYALDKTYRITK
jgi:hypothetical protein